MQELLELATTYGFPVVVSLFFLLKIDSSLQDLNKSIEKLSYKLDFIQTKEKK
ncbi:YvrJ family protein [Vagococcus fluvialis]|uniref:YvrJ family protein n=1 Tax=Vagococcus fluvialis TaxID=2738 RepID=UPI0037920C35